MRLLNDKDNGEVRLAIGLSINSVWSYCLLGVLLDSSMSRTYLRRIRSEKSTDAVKSNVSGGGDWNQNTYHMTKAAHLWRRARIRRYCGDVRCGGSPIVPGLTGREAGIARARLPVPAGGCSDLWSRAA